MAVPEPEPTTVEKLVGGIAAAALPRAISTRLGIVEIGGNAGMWVFADLDTLFFDAILVMAIVLVVRNYRRGSHRTALFWAVVLVTAVTMVVLSYTVTNFGTLFRLRVIVFTSLALVPLALTTAPAVKEADV